MRIPHLAIEHGGPGIPWRLHQRLLSRVVAPRVDLVVAVAREQEPDLLALGYPRVRIEVIPNGVPERQPRRDPVDVRRELGVADDELLALLVAMLRPEKEPEVFVDAIAGARLRGCRVKGAIAGDGTERSRLGTRAQGIQGVALLGERTDVPDLMQAADVVCLSSRVEGLPMAILEAMALGRPIVSTAVGGVPEAVGSDAGVFVPVGAVDRFSEQLCLLSRDAARREAMGRAARRRYEERYGMERVTDAYETALRRLHVMRKSRSGAVGP
jgi:glycosyltransferase involved in cell wall biosynthesis